MEPTEETRAAVEQLAGATGDTQLLDRLLLWSRAAESLVPSCIGLSVTVVLDGDPFTLTATAPNLPVADAIQYLEGGPCVESSRAGDQVNVTDVLDEQRWQRFAAAAQRFGIRSSLSLPIGGSGSQPSGAVNIYASEPNAFVGREQALAAIFRAPAESLVSNADLSFMTLDFAQQLPRRLEERARVDLAVGKLVGVHGWTPAEARTRLNAAAAQAGIPVATVADSVVAVYDVP